MTKQKYTAQANEPELETWSVCEDGSLLYDDLTEQEAKKLAAYMNRTGRWSYNSVYKFMRWPAP